MEKFPGLKPLRLLFATDLHGSESAYVQLLAKADELAADAVVLGGDLTPHSDPAGQALFLRTFLRPQLERFHAANPARRVFGLLGNDDWIAGEALFNALEDDGLLAGLHRRVHPLTENLWIAGLSYVPVTPFGISDWDRLDTAGCTPPRKGRGPLFSDSGKIVSGSMEKIVARPTVETELAALARLSDPAKTVYVIHTPPFNTKLDLMHDMQHIGSAAVRRFIETHRPPLTLHGHIHESASLSGSIADHLGPTLSLNPGDSRETLRAVSIEIAGSAVTWQAVK